MPAGPQETLHAKGPILTAVWMTEIVILLKYVKIIITIVIIITLSC